MKKLIFLAITVLLMSCCAENCSDCKPFEPNFWTSWTCFVGLFLTATAFIFRSKCKPCKKKPAMGMKIHHLLWIACGYLWVVGFIFGIIMWFVCLVNWCEDDWILDDDAFPITRKIINGIGDFFNKDISFNIKIKD